MEFWLWLQWICFSFFKLSSTRLFLRHRTWVFMRHTHISFESRWRHYFHGGEGYLLTCLSPESPGWPQIWCGQCCGGLILSWVISLCSGNRASGLRFPSLKLVASWPGACSLPKMFVSVVAFYGTLWKNKEEGGRQQYSAHQPVSNLHLLELESSAYLVSRRTSNIFFFHSSLPTGMFSTS